MSPHDIAGIETTLRSIGRDIEYPETPNLRGAVMHRIERAPRSVSTSVPASSRWTFRFALTTAAAVTIATFSTLGLSTSARRAVADWLGVDGVRITFDDNISDEPVGSDLALGRRVSLNEAGELVDFEIAIPSELGAPDAVFVNENVEGGEVSLVWEPDDMLPASEHTDVGAVLTQFIGQPDPLSFKKVVGTSDVRYFSIYGGDAYFIEGAPHLIARLPNGETHELTPRLAGNTLLWDGGEVTYRLEAEVEYPVAVEIVESLR